VSEIGTYKGKVREEKELNGKKKGGLGGLWKEEGVEAQRK